MDAENVGELITLFGSEVKGLGIVMDLMDLAFVDRERSLFSSLHPRMDHKRTRGKITFREGPSGRTSKV